MRRKDRQLQDLEELIRLISQSPYMHLALADGAQPYVLALNFGFIHAEGQLRVYFHGAGEGRKAEIIRQNALCCLSFVPRYELVRAQQACGYTARFASVCVEGRVRLVEDPEERIQALDCLMRQLRFEGEPAYREDSLRKTALYCIDAVQITGKASGFPAEA